MRADFWGVLFSILFYWGWGVNFLILQIFLLWLIGLVLIVYYNFSVGFFIMKKIAVVFSFALMFFAYGCTSVPMATAEQDAEAKKFLSVANKASIYLYRNETFGGAIAMPVSLDGKTMGRTGPETFFKWEVEPGTHEVVSHTENIQKLKVDTKPGEIYYVWQEVKMGLFAADSKLHLVDEAKGQAGVKECGLAKNGGE